MARKALAEENSKAESKAETTAPANESKYSIDDFVENAKIFDTSDIIVSAALKLAGKTEYTIAEAKKIVSEFRNKEV